MRWKSGQLTSSGLMPASLASFRIVLEIFFLARQDQPSHRLGAGQPIRRGPGCLPKIFSMAPVYASSWREASRRGRFERLALTAE